MVYYLYRPLVETSGNGNEIKKIACWDLILYPDWVQAPGKNENK